jgi:hypothetical protein
MIWELVQEGKKFSPTEENIDINIYTLSTHEGKQSQKKVSLLVCFSLLL